MGLILGFQEYYTEGFLVGIGTALAVIILVLFVSIRDRMKKARERTRMVLEAPPPQRAIELRLIEISCYFGLAALIFLALYFLITPIKPYDGKVEKKEYVRRGSGTRGLADYFLWVDGRKRSVERDIFVAVEPGDGIRHNFASQCFYINGHRQVAGSAAWNTAFWGGLISVFWLALSVGAFCNRERET